MLVYWYIIVYLIFVCIWFNYFSFHKKIQGNQLRIAITGIGTFLKIVLCLHKPCVVLGLDNWNSLLGYSFIPVHFSISPIDSNPRYSEEFTQTLSQDITKALKNFIEQIGCLWIHQDYDLLSQNRYSVSLHFRWSHLQSCNSLEVENSLTTYSFRYDKLRNNSFFSLAQVLMNERWEQN